MNCKKCKKEKWSNSGIEGLRIGGAMTFKMLTKKYCKCKRSLINNRTL